VVTPTSANKSSPVNSSAAPSPIQVESRTKARPVCIAFQNTGTCKNVGLCVWEIVSDFVFRVINAVSTMILTENLMFASSIYLTVVTKVQIVLFLMNFQRFLVERIISIRIAQEDSRVDSLMIQYL
jgi:hypothetical protein